LKKDLMNMFQENAEQNLQGRLNPENLLHHGKSAVNGVMPCA
jgi:hypothetical protein